VLCYQQSCLLSLRPQIVMIWHMFANGAYPEVSEKTATKADLNWCEVDVTVGCGRASTATSVFATRKGLSAPMPHARFYRRGTTSFLPRIFAVSPGVQQFTSAPVLETEAVLAALCPHASGIGGLKLASRRRLHATHFGPSARMLQCLRTVQQRAFASARDVTSDPSTGATGILPIIKMRPVCASIRCASR
jgi:hypothetical protein